MNHAFLLLLPFGSLSFAFGRYVWLLVPIKYNGRDIKEIISSYFVFFLVRYEFQRKSKNDPAKYQISEAVSKSLFILIDLL